MNSRLTCLEAFGLAGLLLALSASGIVAAGESRAVTPEELKSDWLRQLELRYPRKAVEASKVTPAEDAAGAVDGQIHLDKVQVYAEGKEQNLAIGKPATQSSVSPWSTRHGTQQSGPRLAAADVIEQGLQLAEDLHRSGVPVDQTRQRLVALSQRLAKTTAVSEAADATSIYLQAQRIVRELSLQNPLLDFDTILFVKRAPAMFPHVSDQYYGWWSRPGGGIYLLRRISAAVRPRSAA